jgi:hypothetical protein
MPTFQNFAQSGANATIHRLVGTDIPAPELAVLADDSARLPSVFFSVRFRSSRMSDTRRLVAATRSNRRLQMLWVQSYKMAKIDFD